MNRLFFTHRSPYARIVRIVADVKEIPLELIEVNFQDKPAAFLAASPFGSIPALITDNASYIDSHSIVRYLENSMPTPPVFPAHTHEWALQENRVCLAYGITDRAVTIMKENMRPEELRSASQLSKVRSEICRAIAWFEVNIESVLPFPMLDAIALATALGYLEFRLPDLEWRATSPRVQKWFDEIQGTAVFKQTGPTPS